MKVRILYERGPYDNRVEYVIDFLNNHPLNNGLIFCSSDEDADVNICYGKNSNDRDVKYVIPAQEVIFSTRKVSSDFVANEYEGQNGLLYSVEKSNKLNRKWIEENTIQFDILEMIFFHISRYEEYDPIDNDPWDALKEEQQFLVANKLEKRPVVDELVFEFLNLFQEVEAKTTTYTITHDIDHLRKFYGAWSYVKKALGFIKRGQVSSLTNYFKQVGQHRKTGIDPYDVYDRMLVKNDVNKEIYFLVGGSHKYDTPVDTDDDIFKKSITLAKERGYKIGIHPSYETWKNEEMIIKEKTLLEKVIEDPIDISRQHYLHFSFPETFIFLEKAGIKKDSSIGFNQRIGFRCGTGFPFYLYNVKEDIQTTILEEPLVCMDSAAIKESLANQVPLREMTDAFVLTNSQNTNICFNFHNSRFEESELNNYGLAEIYHDIISRL